MDKKVKMDVNEDRLPGIAIDKADKDQVNEKLVKGDVKKLNNNPRNNDM